MTAKIVMEDERMYEKANLKRLSKFDVLTKSAWAGFNHFNEAAFAPGAIPQKYKELIAVAVGLTTQCPYCIEIHSDAARKAGASDEELAETALVAAAIRAGGAVTHATHMFKD